MLSSNPHAKTSIPEKPSKSDLIGVWHKDNSYLCTSTIGNKNPHTFDYGFIYTSSRLKKENPNGPLLCGLIGGPFTIDPNK